MEFKAAAQYGYMRDSLNRLERLGTDNGSSISHLDAKVLGKNFFIDCHSFKDWLKKEHPTLSTAIEAHITNSPPLALAADIANSMKHGGLDKSPRSGENISTIRQHTRLDFSGHRAVTSATLEIVVNGVVMDAVTLARDCLAAWDTFLEQNGIDIIR